MAARPSTRGARPAGGVDGSRRAGAARPDVARGTALVAVMAGLVAALALVPPVPVGPVPVTLQTFGVGLAAAVLGPWRGAAALGVYVVLGLAGLPVFAGGGSGLGVLAGASAGYIMSWPLAAVVVGGGVRLLARSGRHRRPGWVLVPLLVGNFLVTHPMGVVGWSWSLDVPLRTAALGDLVFVPGDLVKAALAAVVTAAVHRAFPTVLRGRARGRGLG